MQPKFFTLFSVVFIIATSLFQPLAKDVFASSPSFSSPSFVRQEITDAQFDVIDRSKKSLDEYGEGIFADTKGRFVNCSTGILDMTPVDLESVSYISDGRTINGILWLDHPIIDPIKRSRDRYLEDHTVQVQNLTSKNISLKNYFNDTIISELKERIEESPTDYQSVSDIKIMNTTLDGVPAYKIEYIRTDEDGLSIMTGTIISISGEKSYIIRYEGEPEKLSGKIGKSGYSIDDIINSIEIDKIPRIRQEEKPNNYSVYENYGIKIEYPSNWEKINIGDFGLSLETSPTPESYNNFVYVNVDNLYSQNVTLNQFSNATIQDIANDAKNFTILNSSKISLVSGNPAYRIIGTASRYDRELVIMAIFTMVSDRVYSIIYQTEPNNLYKYRETVEKMINSIQFNLKTSDSLLTYQDSDLGIKMLYPSDWKVSNKYNNYNYYNDKNSTFVEFTSPLEIWPLRSISYSMYIDVNSVYDLGVDYVVSLHWDEQINTWERTIAELSSNKGRLEIANQTNYNGFFDEDENYVKLYFDLKTANFPDRYNVLFAASNKFEKSDRKCDLLDVTHFVTVPPPEFIISRSSSDPLIIRPGEEQSIELHIKSDANINSFVSLSTKKINDIDVNFTPNRISLLPSGEATSILQIKALDYSDPHEYTIPIMANISFPQSVEGTFSGQKLNFSNPLSANITNNSNLTLTVKEPLRLDEHLTNFSNAWISPISGIWTFLAGVAAVIAPIIIRKKQKKGQG